MTDERPPLFSTFECVWDKSLQKYVRKEKQMTDEERAERLCKSLNSPDLPVPGEIDAILAAFREVRAMERERSADLALEMDHENASRDTKLTARAIAAAIRTGKERT
jgi:hypothetical protein